MLTAEQIQRAGIVTTPALAALPGAPGTGADGLILSGTVVLPPAALTASSAVWGGIVQQVHVNTLQTVKAGAPLVTLFSQQWMEQQRDYVALAAQARLADDKLARDESLYADGIIARVRLDESRAAAQLARLALSQRVQLLRAAGLSQSAIKQLPASGQLTPLLTVRAQAAGTVLELPLSVGQQAEAGSSVAKIARDVPLAVELQASAAQLAQVAVGDKLVAGSDCHVKVSAISPLVNGVNQTALVRAEQVERNRCLKVNAFVEARLIPSSRHAGALAVPAAALVRRGAATYVFVRNAHGFQAVPVRPGAAAGEQVWVSGALAAGAPVAMRGLAAIKGAWTGLGEPAPAAIPTAKDAKGQP